jgi:hypothetical protein
MSTDISQRKENAMNLKIESCLITIGFGLVLSVAGENAWQQLANAACTQGCSANTRICEGTDITQICACSTLFTREGKTWRNSITRGSTTGTTAISFSSVVCYTVSPCIAGNPLTYYDCDAGLVCVPFAASLCVPKSAGVPITYTVSTCNTEDCPE